MDAAKVAKAQLALQQLVRARACLCVYSREMWRPSHLPHMRTERPMYRSSSMLSDPPILYSLLRGRLAKIALAFACGAVAAVGGLFARGPPYASLQWSLPQGVGA